MKRSILLAFLIPFVIGCQSANTPGTPSTTGGSNGAVTIGFPYIAAFTFETQTTVNGQVFLADSNGPVTNAAVTFSYNGGTTPVTYTDNKTEPVTVNGFIILNLITAHYQSGLFSSDVSGQACTLSASMGGMTYSSSITTVGDSTFSPGASGITCLWVGGGNSNGVSVYPGTLSFGPGLTSPYYIPNSSLPGYSPGTYAIVTNLEKDSAFSGLSSSSYFNSYASDSTTY